MINTKKLKTSIKKINNRRKSRELIMKGVYRALVNKFDTNQIKKDIQDDPDFIRADEAFFLEIIDGVFDNFDLLKKEIITYLDKSYDELSPIELAIIYGSLYELKFSLSVPYRVVINEAIEIAKSFGGTDGHKFINGVLNKAAAINRKNEFVTKIN
jgi:N utilization substance protein B